MHLVSLTLDGFKSFAERTQIPVQSGVTAIVGPNGCGKSNIIEALRWVMGEVSAKRLRGEEMTDVIFGGAQARAPRQSAYVGVRLQDEGVPDGTQTDVSRTLDRKKGSHYRINGRVALARDIQLLFADHSMGAAASAIIGQGRIASLIAAKPTERRQLLEEAAGIRGLEARRHDAEVKLRNAQINIGRVEERIAAEQRQFDILAKQARQAKLYRTLSEAILANDRQLLAYLWIQAHGELLKHTQALEQRQAAFAQAQTQHLAGVTALTNAEAEWLHAQDHHQGAREELQTEQLAHQRLQNDLQNVISRQETLITRMVEAQDNRTYEQQQWQETNRTLEKLTEERAILVSQTNAMQTTYAEHQQARDAKATIMQKSQQDYDTKKAALAHTQGERTALAAQLAQTRSERNRVKGQLQNLERELATSIRPEGCVDDAMLANLQETLSARVEEFDQANARENTARNSLASAQLALSEGKGQARQTLDSIRADCQKYQAEIDTLQQILTSDGEDKPQNFIHHVAILPGWEDALAAAFGEELSCHDDEAATMFWRTASQTHPVALPQGCKKLA
ncbi:MAG: AAA family ATPase, partial [Pseudomonadota bacterium]